MARMHSRKKGKAKSTKPSTLSNPSWLRYKEKEVELLIVKLAKEGQTASQIGLHLRDTYGIPSAKEIIGKNISKLLKDKKLLSEIPEDLLALIKKEVAIRRHLEENKQDMTGLRGLQLTESKIKRLVKYYKKTGRMASEWKYDPDRIRLYVE